MIHIRIGSTAVVALAMLVAFTSGAAPADAADPPVFDGGRALEHLRSVVGFGPRPAGSAASEETRRYIRAQMAAIGV